MEKKTQILIAHQKQGIDWTKKVQLAAKKSSARDKRILPLGTWHLALGTWHLAQILIAHQKERMDRTKKGRLAAKKSSARD